jgi:glycosyltransferase involved in cell wall biosynthesis
LDCIESVLSQDRPVQAILVDNGSKDGSAAAATARFRQIELVRPHSNLGYAGGANLGALRALGEIVLFLNPDVRLAPGCLAGLQDEFRDPRVAVAGPRLNLASHGVDRGNTIDPFGYPTGGSEAGPLYVPGCALATRMESFRELKGFDERFFMFAEDVDYCWRALLRGWQIRVSRRGAAYHQGGGSTPGGYKAKGVITTTPFRIGLRERNTLGMLLKCYGRAALTVILPLYVLQALMTAAVLLALGQRGVARAILSGLVWNVRELPRTWRLRRSVQSTRTLRERAVWGRMHHGIVKLELFLSHGLPRVLGDEDRVGPINPLH